MDPSKPEAPGPGPAGLFAGQTAFITGASSGIGRAIARELGAGGARLILAGRIRGALEVTAEPVVAAGGQVELCPFDLLDPAATDGALAAVRERHRRIDLLIHSAGVVTLGAVASASLEDLDLNYRINLRAPFQVTQALLGPVRAAKGQLVFVNSGAGLNARAGWSHYAASNHGLKALADALREERKADGVRVLTVYPGRTATPMQARVRQLEGAAYRPEDFIRPEDVSLMVCQALALPRTADVVEINIRPG